MRMKVFGTAIILLVILAAATSEAQWKRPVADAHGSLREEVVFRHQANVGGNSQENAGQDEQLSPLRAGLFSLAIPGSGQLYSERYLEAAAFAVIEAGLWIAYSHYQTSGDEKTRVFRSYADERWSAVAYADWMTRRYGVLLQTEGTRPQGDLIIDPNGSRWERDPWNSVNWSVMNQWESAIARLQPPYFPNGFTHILPVRPAQQYYELIGKYPQYVGGWNDAWASDSTILYLEADILTAHVTPNFLSYRDMRGEANSFYNNATAAAYVLVANHVFSALEAAFGASRHNRRIRIEGKLLPVSQEAGLVILTPTAFVIVTI